MVALVKRQAALKATSESATYNTERTSFWPTHLFAECETMCAIHLERIDLGNDSLIRFPCGHVVCYECFMKMKRSICCMCRRPLNLYVTATTPAAVATLEAIPIPPGLHFHRSGNPPYRRRRRTANRPINNILTRSGVERLRVPFDFHMIEDAYETIEVSDLLSIH